MAQNTTMHNLATLIKRLEAATSRLEDIATSTIDTPTNSTSNSTSSASGTAAARANGPSTFTSKPPSPPATNGAVTGSAAAASPSIEGFDKLINDVVKQYAHLSGQIGGLVAEQAASVQKAFAAERKFLIVTTRAKKPDTQSATYMECLKELQDTLGAVDRLRDANRGSSLSNHLTTVSEGIPMLGWVAMERKPADYVVEMLNASEFYGNRVYKEHKDKDKLHVEWVQAYYGICKGLVAYIKEYYPSGITWNTKDGIDAQQALKEVEAGGSDGPSMPAAGYAPPPPPPLPNFDSPGPSRAPSNASASKSGSSSDMTAVFDQISRGESVTSGLRKVDPSQQTHKNPALRGQGTSQPSPLKTVHSSSSGNDRGSDAKPTKRPPHKTLDGTKWFVEHYDAPNGTIEIEASLSHSVLISRCNKATIRIKGKANAISVDSSSSIALIIDSLVSAVDVIKTPKFQLQVLGSLPTIMLDQVDDASLYLSRQSLNTEVFTSKCSAVNINVPGPGQDDDYNECPVPEQIKTVLRNGRAVSEIVEHAG